MSLSDDSTRKPPAIARRTLTQHVMDYVRNAAVSGELKPGELYSVYQLAERLGVSRSPVRDGLLRLEEAGMLQFSRNRGFKLLPTTPADVAEIFSIRIALEVPAARRAAASDGELGTSLADIRQRMLAAASLGDEESFFALDQELHDEILIAGGARRAREIIDRMRAVTRMLAPSTVTADRTFDSVIAEHDPIVEAIVANDAGAAAETMRKHLVSTGRLLVSRAVLNSGTEEDLDELWDRLTAGYIM